MPDIADRHAQRVSNIVQPQATGPSVGKILLGVLLGMIALGWLVSSCSGDSSGSEPSQSSMTTEARAQCRESVKDKLKAPSTAKFSDEQVSGSGPDAMWSVSGAVDSENSFGAMIRSSYSCQVKFSGGEPQTVQVLSLT